MGFLSSLKTFFSGTTAADPVEAAIEHQGFTIIPAPQREGGQYRVAATITKGEDEAQQTHHFIRSDLIASRDECLEVTIRKAKMTIDQLGDRIFG
ncbi:transcriptional regulator [Marinomonas agarivorans]|nr:transcriptional regulator [Marinomonas agarivorans]